MRNGNSKGINIRVSLNFQLILSFQSTLITLKNNLMNLKFLRNLKAFKSFADALLRVKILITQNRHNYLLAPRTQQLIVHAMI